MYKTKQQEALLRVLENNVQASYSVDELFSIPQIAQSMGKSTLYRLVDKLVKSNQIKRITSAGSRRVSYQLVSTECQLHLHLVCEVCGGLIHADNLLSRDIISRIESDSAFLLNNAKTIIYGTCKGCRKERARS